MAAVLAAGEGAVLSHLSAASLFEVSRRRVSGSDVSVTAEKQDQPGIRVHVTRNLHPRDVTRHRAIPVTTVPRTLVDLSDALTAHQLANVIHEAQYRRLFDLAAVRAAVARANGRRNLDVLSKALELQRLGSAGTKSGLEDRFLELVKAADLGEPLVNVQVAEIRVDFHWPQHDLVVEVDGPGHKRPRTKREDARRDRALKDAGLKPLRFDETDLQDPHRVVAALLARRQ